VSPPGPRPDVLVKEVNPDAARLLDVVSDPSSAFILGLGRHAPGPARTPRHRPAVPMEGGGVAPKAVLSSRVHWQGLAEVLDGSHAGQQQVPGRMDETSRMPLDQQDLLLDRSMALTGGSSAFSWTGQDGTPSVLKAKTSSVPPLPSWLKREISRANRHHQVSNTSTASLASVGSDVAAMASILTKDGRYPDVRPAQVNHLESQYPTGIRDAWQRMNNKQQKELERKELAEAQERGVRLARHLAGRWLKQVKHKERMERQRLEELAEEERQRREKEEAIAREQARLKKEEEERAAAAAAEAARAKAQLEKERELERRKEEDASAWGDPEWCDDGGGRLGKNLFGGLGAVTCGKKDERLSRLDGLRKNKARKKEAESDEEDKGPKLAKPPPEFPTGDAETDKLLEAFLRYDADQSGQLDLKECRACLTDIGIQPSLPQEKRAVLGILQSLLGKPSQQASGGLDFYDLVKLIPRIKESIAETKRKDLEDWFTRGLDERGIFDEQQLGSCLEATGCTIQSDWEWQEVMNIFTPILHPAPPTKKKKRIDPAEEIPEEEQVPEPSPFEKFEKCIQQVLERLTVMRRQRERDLAEEHKLSDEQLEEFRGDMVAWDALFRKFDVDDGKTLDENEVSELLVECGVNSKVCGTTEQLNEMLSSCKERAKTARRQQLSSTQLEPEQKEVKAAGWKKMKKAARKKFGKRMKEKPDEWEIVTDDLMEIDFFEFLYLMKLVRQRDHEGQQERLKYLFEYYDQDRSGEVAIKEVTRLFRDLGLTPRSRQEQLEIKQILDEVDENGDGTFTFPEFAVMVQRCQERLERLVRIDEERYAVSLGYTVERCKELRKLFQEFKHPDYNVLFITELRQVMNVLQRWYTSAQLHEVFAEFASTESGGIMPRGFLRMMYAIEIAQTHGQLPERKKRDSFHDEAHHQSRRPASKPKPEDQAPE